MRGISAISLGLIFCSGLAFAQGVTATGGGGRAGASKAFNPDISVNFLGLYLQDPHGSQNRTVIPHNGLSFQEAEMQFIADVDPYFRANALFSMSQKAGTTDFAFDPEEVYAETISLPAVTVRAGKFKSALGKHNTLHTHAFPFIDAPLINTDLLGDEGLNDMAVSGALLIPTSWFTEFTAQAVGTNNPNIYNPPNSGKFAGVAQLRNLWDLSDDLTYELALYGTTGSNQFLAQSYLYGSDLIFKWRPAEGGKYKALIWQTEYMNRQLSGGGASNLAPQLGGVATWLQWQFAQLWWLQGRVEYEGFPRSPEISAKRKQSALLAFFPSEFSGFRVQFDHINGDNLDPSDTSVRNDYRVAFQWNFSIGAHPAHAY
jgi:hypothetical protein